MNSFQVRFADNVEKDFRKIPKKDVRKIEARIEALATDPNPPGSVKLVGRRDLHRIRVGNYRVIYQIQDEVLIILIVEVGHRKDIYRSS